MNIHSNLSIAQRVFGFFEPQHAPALIEYAKCIAAIKSDFTICMARKAARLHDLLELANCAMPDRPMMFNHVLEQKLNRFNGKTVTLVDDTLILGTTLARAKKTLLDAGASKVETVVFATDVDEWETQLIRPEKVFATLHHDALLSFCAAEVQALAAFSIPYLSDFPFYQQIRLTKSSLSVLQSLPFWETYPLTTDASSIHGVACYSVLPGDSRSEIVKTQFGQHIARLVDICKLRVYIRRTRNNQYWVRIVPVATLFPLVVGDVERLFDALVSQIESSAATDLSEIRINLETPLAKLRFVQYLLSTSVGHAYCKDLSEILTSSREPQLSLHEAGRLFGPWLSADIQTCHEVIANESKFSPQSPRGIDKLQPRRLPRPVAAISQEECEEFLSSATKNSDGTAEIRTLRTDLERIFLQLHEHHELPARQEVRKHGANVLDLDAASVPHRDRLKFGFAWQTIASAVLKRECINSTPKRAARLSVLLDMLIDAGIAVPFLCARDGVYFRAYRHGEDVPFANQEAALAHDIASGYLETSGRITVPKLTFEKLLVSLIKVGVSRKFLQPIHDINGSVGGIVRVGYHLHGAVANFPLGNNAIADNADSWLSSYLVSSGVFSRKKDEYLPGRRPEAAMIRPDASSEASQLGMLIGLLSSARNEDGTSVLSLSDLTILASCAQPRDSALALVAELKIISRGVGLLPAKLAKTQGKRREQHSRFVIQHLYTALNSARLKLAAYRTKRAQSVVKGCAAFLSRQPNGSFLERHWRSSWEPIVCGGDPSQSEAFENWITEIAEEIRRMVEGIFTMELSIASALAQSGEKIDVKNFEKTCEKIRSYLEDPLLPSNSGPLRRRLQQICSTREPIQDVTKAYEHGFEQCRNRMFTACTLVSQVSEFAMAFGRTDRKMTFQYCVWYDIIDSTGQKSGLRGDELRAYRERVRAFKNRINQRLAGLQVDARNRNITLYPWSNTLTAKDDEKNVFLAGPRSIDFVSSAIAVLLNESRVHRMRIRLVAIETDFAGTRAFKFEADSDVQGEAFWEHGSRVRGYLKSLEDKEKVDCSYVWLAGALRQKPERLVGAEDWLSTANKFIADTVIENHPVKTGCLGGPIRTA